MKRIPILIITIAVFLLSTTTKGSQIISIKNEYIEAGFLPGVGGRMVYLAAIGSENVLFSDSTLWNENENERVDLHPEAGFKAYNGHITWLGPQSDWWKQQDLLPEKRSRGDMWPPDPYLLYSNFEIIEKTDTSIVLQGKESPVSGVKLTKKFILNDNQLNIEVSATNCRETKVAWDIWSNARFDAFTHFKVPIHENSILKISAEESKFMEKVEYTSDKGFFTFKPEMPLNPTKQRRSKAYIHPSEGKIYAETNDTKLSINFDLLPPEKIHPDQALIEVYNSISATGSGNLLELEHHSAYKTLEPGESMTLSEVWILEAKPRY
jgi:hypothetical protein